MFAQYFSSHPVAKSIYENILEWWQIIFAFTLLVGVATFIKSNLKNISQKKDTAYRSISLLGLVLMPILAMIGGTKIDSPFLWVFENMQAPMQATVFSLLAFFVASASYRGFRARSIPATILLVTALIVLIGRIPIAEHISDSLPKLAFWIQNNPSMSARRAILIGIGLGSMTTALRVILGIERTYLRGG
jgi:asparagine N-glycosylation enzyme membrane subunit Stt3